MTRITILYGLLLLFSTLGYAQNSILKNVQQQLEEYDSLQRQEKIYVHTDRTLYEQGESLWFNVYVSDANNCPSSYSPELHIELLNPKGEVVQTRILQNKNGCSEGHFELLSKYAGGIYTIKAYSYWMRNFEETHYFEKEITIQEAVFPNVLMKLDFEREAYGANSQVLAEFEAKTKENKALENKELKFDVALDGINFCTETTKTDEAGKAYLVFNLPKDLTTSAVLLNLQLEHEGLTEAISRTVPVVLNNLDVQLLPEGGNWVANQTNRMAFKVLNEFGKPADIKAELIDEKNQVLATVESYHQGMGAFELTPEKGKQYHLKIIEPQGIEQTWQLPKAQDKVGLYLKKQTEEGLSVAIYNEAQQPLYVVAQQHGKIVFSQALNKVTKQSIDVPTQKLPIGILQITLFNEAQKPLSERLVFVNKHRRLNIDIRTNKEIYLPREAVELELEVKDETGQGVEGNFSLAVVNDQQHHFIDDKQDNMLSHLLMSSDLKGKVFEPNFYFDKTEPKADTALDYVLLTHGWSRYTWQQVLDSQQGNWLDTIPFKIDSDEISGYLKIDEKLFPNEKIFLYKKRPANKKVKALWTTWTNKNGFFKFKKADLKFPIFLAVRHQGNQHVVKINGYSKAGLKLLKLEDADKYLDKESIPDPSGFDISSAPGVTGLKGHVIDVGNDEGLPFANVVLEQNGVQVVGTQTDFDGLYFFTNIDIGTYDLMVSYVGYPTEKIEGVAIEEGMSKRLNIAMEEIDYYMNTRSTEEKYILIDERAGKVEEKIMIGSPITIIPKEDIRNIPTRSIQNLTVRRAGVNSADEGEAINANGSRISSNETYIDGVRVIGNFGVPEADIESIEIITSGVPAEYEGLAQMIVHNYRMPLIDPNNTSGGQTLNSSDIDPSNYGSGSSGNKSRFFKINYDKVALFQVGVRSNYFVPKAFYQPKYSIQEKVEQRSDFRQTIYWNPNIETDAKGKATMSYCNSDAVTSFRIIVEGRSQQGQLGHDEQTYAVTMPFSLMAKLPANLSYFDTLHLPIQLKNNSSETVIGALSMELSEGLELLDPLPQEIKLSPNKTEVVYLTCQVKPIPSKAAIKITFEGEGIKDVVQEYINIYPKGFGHKHSMSGFEKEQKDTFIIDDYYDGSLEATLNVYPSIMDGLMDAVQGMIRAPYGCFEQVSSSNYPNILALQLMEQLGEVAPKVRHQAVNYLKDGYAKLTAYEISGGGFDWYGEGPANEGLSAYGLVQFEDMKAVYDSVDQAMIERTKGFLLSRRNGTGGFYQKEGRYGFSGNRKEVFNAYITWALAKTGTANIEQEITTTTRTALRSKDIYLLSLSCLTNFYVGNKATAEQLLKLIQKNVKIDALSLVQANATLTNSWGSGRNVECLSFVALALMQSEKKDRALLLAIIEYIERKREFGTYGSTQSTVMALKALSEFQKQVIKKGTGGTFVLSINNKQVIEQAYHEATGPKIVFENLAKHLKIGSNTMKMHFKTANDCVLPYALDVNWKSKTAKTDKSCPIKIQNNWNKKQTKIGETVRLEINLSNQLDKALPSPMAIVGIPAGLSLQPWQLKELKEKGLFDYYELNGNRLFLYFRGLHPKEQRKIVFDLRTETPGHYAAPASVAYLYYQNELKDWTKGTSIQIER